MKIVQDIGNCVCGYEDCTRNAVIAHVGVKIEHEIDDYKCGYENCIRTMQLRMWVDDLHECGSFNCACGYEVYTLW